MHTFKIGDWVYGGDWCYGQIADVDMKHNYAIVEYDTGSGGGSMMFDYEELTPAEAPTKLNNLPQYHFDRDEMCEVFFDVFTTDEYVDIKVECGRNRHFDEFSLLRWEDEFYIVHRNSGVIINWYKNMGRTNTCNKPDFTLDDFREFLIRLRKELVWYKVIEDIELLEEMADAGWE